ncbi:MAG: lactate utilization protein [Selenomonadales bacterium]|nr:lactate utilization protein [Selenomonadales bacterium]MDD6218544.1 lactate utilization protein [Selenomonadaceae bacterium]
MEKVCRDWPKEAFGEGLVDAGYWQSFEENAKAAAAEIYRVKNFAEAEKQLANLLKEFAPKEILAVGGEENPALKGIYERIAQPGIEVFTDKFDIAEHKASADIGISTAEFCIAETGSLVVDNYSYEARVTSMLPFVNIVFVNAKYVVENVSVACKIIGQVFTKGYCGFVTGPSRTADIERVLSLGVHGPNRLLIIAVDDFERGR